MLGDIFYWVFNMSIAAIICGIPVLLLGKLKRIPRRIFVMFWLIPFIRMTVPVGLTGKYGLMTLISKFTTKTVTIYTFDDISALTMVNYTMLADDYFPISFKVDLLENLFSVASLIWIIVSAGLILAFLVIYLITINTIRDSEMLMKGIYLSDKIKSPAVYGIIKPKILLPYDYKECDLEYILLHEKIHIKRFDNFFRVLALITVCFHWF